MPVADHVPASQEVGTCFFVRGLWRGTNVARWDSMDLRRVALLFFATIVACREDDTVQVTTVTSATVRAPDVAFGDYRGSFHGANVYASFEARGGIASGTFFYEADGLDVPLRGGIDDRGALVLSEIGDKGTVSTVTLRSDPSGAWSGTWESGDASRSGAARLEPIARARGAEVFIATRHTRRDHIDVRAPVVLGLGDRVFEKKLDDALQSLAQTAATDVGAWVTVDYLVPLNERGFLSIIVNARYANEVLCDAGAACIGTSSGLSAAVDARAIATSVWDVVDPVKVRKVRAARRLGATGVLTRRGVSFLYDEVEDGMHAPAWDEISFDDLGGALRRGSAFEPLWKR